MASLEQTTMQDELPAQCQFCRGRSFRRSTLRFKDLGVLMLLRYPVRCLQCSKRQSVWLSVARQAMPSSVKQLRAPRNAMPWQDWDAVIAASGQPESSAVGGTSFTALPVHEPLAMPNLQGMTLQHLDRTPAAEDAPKI
jgi:hypothetical protein